MVTFFCKESPKAFFSFKGSNYNFIDGRFTTDDKDLIEFLKNNPNIEEVKTVTENVKSNQKKTTMKL